MVTAPFYDPARSYQDNFDHGPFGLFAEDAPALEAAGVTGQSFLGHPVGLPFGIPAGPLINGTYVKAALDWGFDLPMYKTVRTRAYPAHAWPNVLAVQVEGDLRPGTTLVGSTEYREPLSITNSFGVPSFDPDFWQPDMAGAVRHARLGQVVIASFQGTLPETGGMVAYLADFRAGARLVRETGAKIVEVNLSCPNEGTANLLCFDTARARAVVEAVQEELGEVPLLIKMAYFEDDEKLRGFVRELGPVVQGMSAINTVSAKIVNATGEQALPGEGRLSSGVCGAAIQWAGVAMVEKLRRLREDLGLVFAIVGVGGVSDAAGYERFMAAGADAVMSATAAMWNPRLALEIKAGVREHAHAG